MSDVWAALGAWKPLPKMGSFALEAKPTHIGEWVSIPPGIPDFRHAGFLVCQHP